MPHGYEVGYRSFAINGRMLGHGEPIRVKPGERVLFHILNGSATEIRSLALPVHTFKVVALGGNPVPAPAEVPVLWLGTAERVSAIVEMNHPGVWVLGDLSDDDREHGMGIVVEYAKHKGKPQWARLPFSGITVASAGRMRLIAPDEAIDMSFAKQTRRSMIQPMDHQRCAVLHENGGDVSAQPRQALSIAHGNMTMTSIQCISIGTASSTPKSLGNQPGYHQRRGHAGWLPGNGRDFTADQPGLSLFHCHMQLHMDYSLRTFSIPFRVHRTRYRCHLSSTSGLASKLPCVDSYSRLPNRSGWGVGVAFAWGCPRMHAN
jgi:FtsP/CotA-like multicopper oxidase with cupredoxin domain